MDLESNRSGRSDDVGNINVSQVRLGKLHVHWWLSGSRIVIAIALAMIVAMVIVKIGSSPIYDSPTLPLVAKQQMFYADATDRTAKS
jgi:hypothetical protein